MAGIIKKIASQDYVTTEASSIANDVVDVKLESHVVSWDKIVDAPFTEQEDGVVTLNETYIPNTIARVSDLAAPKTELILTSTEDNTKNFKITINSNGVLTIEEILEKYSWEGVFASIDKGTYATDYAIGDCIPLDLGSEGVINMQIAAFDADDLADGSGKAPITWIAKELLATKCRMNGSTGDILNGGWAVTELRNYLKDTIKPMIPVLVRNAIVEITKYNTIYGGNTYATEDVWIPNGYGELVTGRDVAKYINLFPDDASRKKCIVGSTTTSDWWTRSISTQSNFYYIDTSGELYDKTVTSAVGICLCFCT